MINGFGLKTNVHNLAYAEELYALHQRDPLAVPPAWREYFASAATGPDGANGISQPAPSFRRRGEFDSTATTTGARGDLQLDPREASVHDRLHELIRNYRVRGHIIAQVDPLGSHRPCPPELNLDYYAFTERELDLLMSSATLTYDQPLSIREIYQRLRNTYSRSIGVQFMHIDDVAVRQWLQRRMESSQNRLQLAPEEQRRILTRLTDAVIFEEFLRTKFVGAKTFSLEGCETLVPLLDLAIEQAGAQGVRDIVLGMAHRGRLNVLANVVGKEPRLIFREFADVEPELHLGGGDVRYHLGHSGDWTTSGGQRVHLSLCFNPSHLEFIGPVVLGRVRARQERQGDRERRQVLGLLIHGDAAFAGEGIVQETLNFSRLAGYGVGGLLHVIVNNQLGFTTPPSEGRSTPYATDVARLLQIPIFHVNGEDPEAVAQAVRLAMDFRREFQVDVVLDMYGYRRWGHNETDEPSFTQPMLYRMIERRPNVRAGYLQHLLKLNGVSAADADKLAVERRQSLEQQLTAAQDDKPSPPEPPVLWRDWAGGPEPAEEPETGVPSERLAELLHRLTQMPRGFALHPKLERGMKARREMADNAHPLDWSAAEALALASLATSGVRIRLTGQDTARGTFSQRHAVLHDQQDGSPFIPLQHLAPEQAAVEVFNSPLNEAGSLGFEYGYSLDCPDGLVLWEAQFGDFANAAQVIIDQFLASAEDKWRRLSGLVLLLPHGFEGMGAEHSSARIERFLALAAEDNLQLVQPTTPAQYFHCLRRQALWRWRKPLVVFTPKSLLRHSQVTSSLDDCARGQFHRVLSDSANQGEVKRILLSTGKVFYELAAHRQQGRHDVALLRLEQLYPLRAGPLENALGAYRAGTPVFWVQEEPENMGAWRYLRGRFDDLLFGRWPLQVICRPESASPATGSSAAHKLEQAELLRRAFGEETPPPKADKAEKHSPAKPSATPT
jgi:2-oxoglutarate dehydrogenase E1 component